MEHLYPSLHQVEVAARDGALAGLVDTLLTRAKDRSDTASGWLARALRVDLATLVLDPALTLRSDDIPKRFSPHPCQTIVSAQAAGSNPEHLEWQRTAVCATHRPR